MKILGAALSAALAAPVQRPALLVGIWLSTPVFWTSATDVTVRGRTWRSRDVDVVNLSVQAFSLSGTLLIGNADGVAGALLLNDDFCGTLIRIFGYDAAAPTEVVHIAEAVGGRAVADLDAGVVSVTLRHPCEGMVSPAATLSSVDLGPMLREGTVLRINGQDLRLARSSGS